MPDGSPDWQVTEKWDEFFMSFWTQRRMKMGLGLSRMPCLETTVTRRPWRQDHGDNKYATGACTSDARSRDSQSEK